MIQVAEFDADAPPRNMQMKVIIWDFITKHYQRYTHNPKASVSWVELKSNPNHFLDAEYYPESFEFNDPSHIRQKSSEALLAHWSHRRDNDQVVFEFTRCKEGSMRDTSLTKRSHRKPQITKKKIKTCQKVSSKAKGKRRARESESEAEESDTESDSSGWRSSGGPGQRDGGAGAPASSNSEMVDTDIAGTNRITGDVPAHRAEYPKSPQNASGDNSPQAGSPESRHEPSRHDCEKAESPLALVQSNSAAQGMVHEDKKMEEAPTVGAKAPATSTKPSPKVTRSQAAKSDLKTDEELQGRMPAMDPSARPS
ncbi:hypothetical protein JAAARDRAFT_200516 [Jaapia argillacea MUCL 33604]|uniref:Uncharacterized protein n=1 Tax=Jaapia argillacea MUCL 33604 TaxID=933084 RepID=A0A067PFN0_9AGAM|nr:hypothetical protein JAAARDRAFT_200516 [Jaapia argillacea MUCL 33604]